MRQSQWDLHLFAGVVQTQVEAEEKIRQVLGSILTQQMLQLVILNQTLQLSRVINQTAFRIHFCMYRFVIGFNFSLGTGKFIRENGNVLSQEETLAITECNKDTGGRKTLQSWSRGVFLVVSRGGHIEYWQPLYR